MLPNPLQSTAVLPWEHDLKIDQADEKLPGMSIVIPIFNAGDFLEKTLRSLLCNDLNGVEIILMDGGSNDNTRDIVAHYADMFSHTVFEKDEGQSDAINKGYALASKPILYWLNGDDILLPNTLVEVRRAFKNNSGTEVVVGDAYLTEKDFTPIHHFTFSKETLTFSYLLDYAKHHLIQPSVFFSRKAWDVAGPVKLDHHYAMDADLFLGMASKYTFLHLPKDIAYSVYHEDCKTRDKRGESITELALVQARHGGFAEARNTLNLLVDLFNEAEKKSQTAQSLPQQPTGNEEILNQRIKSLETSISRNKELLLELDLDLEGT